MTYYIANSIKRAFCHIQIKNTHFFHRLNSLAFSFKNLLLVRSLTRSRCFFFFYHVWSLLTYLWISHLNCCHLIIGSLERHSWSIFPLPGLINSYYISLRKSYFMLALMSVSIKKCQGFSKYWLFFSLVHFNYLRDMRKGTTRHLKRKMSHRLKGQSHELTGTKNKTKNKFSIHLFGEIVINSINMMKYHFNWDNCTVLFWYQWKAKTSQKIVRLMQCDIICNTLNKQK